MMRTINGALISLAAALNIAGCASLTVGQQSQSGRNALLGWASADCPCIFSRGGGNRIKLQNSFSMIAGIRPSWLDSAVAQLV